jgi:hypothetical protein
MSDIFSEVEEDVRREQAKLLWDRYGLYVIGVAVLIVLGTAGWRGWEWYSAKQAAEAGAEYYAAMELVRTGKNDEAESAFDVIAAKGGGFGTLSRMRAAATKAAAGDKEGAVAEFDAVASSSSVQPDLRNAAHMRAAYILLGMNDRAGIEQRIGDMATEGGPWRASAREVLGLAAYQAGDYAVATQRFEEVLSDPETPGDMRNRAQLLMSLLAADRAPLAAAPAESGAAESGAAENQ